MRFIWLVVTALIFAETNPSEINSSARYTEPIDTVQAFEKITINLLKMSENTTPTERYLYILSEIENIMDFKTITKLVLGNHLIQNDKNLESEFANELMRLTARTMTLNYTKYTSQRYETVKRKKNREKALIYTKFHISKGEVIPFRFVLRNNQENWQIINIIASGVSELSLKKIEYEAFLATKTLSELMHLIKNKNRLLPE